MEFTGYDLRHNLPPNGDLWQVGLLDIVPSEYSDKSHNFFCKIPVVLENRRSSQPYPVWLSCRRKSYPVKQAASGVWT